MRVRDLGALTVAADGDERPVTGVRATAMLALLTINVNRRVSVDALMDAAWGEQITPGAASSLESHVWRLRRLLEPGRPRRRPPTVLVSDGGGYRLVAGPHDVDSSLFEELAGEVRDLLAGGHASAAVTRADAALALWRGRPFGPLAEHPWARAAVARLDELHGQVQARRVEALVGTGALDEALSDLEPLIRATPFRERLRALQMLALYRSGRSEQALQCYRDTHRLLVEEIGTGPGAELRDLHRRILEGDVELDARPGPPLIGGPRTSPRPGDVHLPAALTPLVGRDDVLGPLRDLVVAHRLVTVVGPAGCGKTRLAIEVARSAAPAFTDGVWFVDLAAVPEPRLVVDVVVSTLGIATSPDATPLEDLGTYLRARRVLLVLDNCEHVLPVVADLAATSLAPPAGTADPVACAVLATSREPLGVDGEVLWTLDPLEVPEQGTTTSPAVELFLHRLHAAVPTLVVDEHVRRRAAEICVAVDGLPLPIELAAARARVYTLDDVAVQVATDPGRLGRPGRGAAEDPGTVWSTIESSHRLLATPEQVVHRRLAVLPGPFTVDMAAAVVGVGGVDDLLVRLVDRSMVASDASRRAGGPTAFRQLAVVRAHARAALSEAGEIEATTARRDAWVLDLVGARPRLGRPAESDWYGSLDDGYATVRATLARHLIDEPDAVGAWIAGRLSFYWYYRARVPEGRRWLQLAHEVVRETGSVDATVLRLTLASSLALQGRVDLAGPHVAHVLDHLPLVPPDRLVDVGEAVIGVISAAFVPAAWLPAAAELVVALHEQLAGIVDRAGDADLELVAAAVGCSAAFSAGRWQDAVRDSERVHERAVAAGNLTASWQSAAPPMLVAMLAGRPEEGLRWFARLIEGHRRLGTGGLGSPLEVRANFAAQTGDHVLAATLYAAARTENRRAALPWPRWPLTHDLIELTRDRLPPDTWTQARQDGETLSVQDILRTT